MLKTINYVYTNNIKIKKTNDKYSTTYIRVYIYYIGIYIDVCVASLDVFLVAMSENRTWIYIFKSHRTKKKRK